MPIDLSSVRVQLVKFFCTIDIIDRVKDYLSAEGIFIPNAPIPSGTYTVRISLADVDGRMATRDVSLSIM